MNSPEPAAAERPEPPPRPRAGRRWLRRISWALGVLAVLFGLLHTPPAKRLISSALVSLAGRALSAEVGVDRLDYRLWAGVVRVKGLRLQRPGLQIECARAEVNVGLGRGVQVDVEAPRVVVTQGPPGDDEPPTEPSQPWAILGHLDAVTLQRGAVEVRSREETPWLRLGGIEVTTDTPNDRLRGTAHVAEADVGWPGAGVRFESIGAKAEFELEPDSGAVRILHGEVVSGGTKLEGQGRLKQIEPILARAEGGGRVDARLLQRLVPDLEIEGQIETHARFEKDAVGTRGSVEVDAAHLQVFEIGPWSGAVRATLQDRRLQIDSLSLAAYQGRAEAGGVVFLGDGPSEIEVRASDLNVKALVGTFVDDPPPLASRVDADVRISIEDWEVDTLQGQGRLSLRPAEGEGWPVAGPVRVDLADRRVSFASDDLRVRAMHVATDGLFSVAKDLDLRYVVRVPDLDGVPELLADAGLELPNLVLGGGAGVEGEVTGRLPDWRATARIASDGMSVEEIDIDIEAALNIRKSGIEVESFAAEGDDGRLSVDGFVPLDGNRNWDVKGSVEKLRLTDALGLHGLPLRTTARGRLRVEGPKGDPTARFEVEARAEPVEPARLGRDTTVILTSSAWSVRPDLTSDVGETARHPEELIPGQATKDLRPDGEIVGSDEALRMTEKESGPRGSEFGMPGPDAENDADDPSPVREPATLHLTGTASRRGVVVDELAATAGGGVVEASGAWLRDGNSLDARARMADIQLARLPWLPGPAALGELRSALSGEADLSGRLDAPEGQLSLLLADTRYRGQTFRDLVLEAVLDGAQARLGGRLGEESLLSGQLVFEESWPLHADLELAALPLTRVLRALPGAGSEERFLSLTGRASLDVPLRETDVLRYEARVEALDTSLGGEGASAGAFQVGGSRDAVAIRGLDLRSGATRLRADGELGLASEPSSPLVLLGDFPLSEVATFLPDAELEGKATVDLTLGGRLGDLTVTGELRLDGGAGNIGPVVLDGLGLEATAREGVLTILRAELGVAGGQISVQGELPLRPRSEGATTLEFQLQGVDPGTLLAPDRGEPPVVAPLDMSGRVRATAPALDAIEGEGEITGWSVSAGKETLVLEKAAGWRYREGRLTVDDLRLAGGQGHVGLEGTWAPEEGGQLHLSGETDLALLDPLLGGELFLSGPGRVDLTVSGDVDDLSLEGGASLENVRAVLREPPVVVSNLTGSLAARGRALEIDARGSVGDGALRVSGRVGLAPTGPELDLALDAEHVPLTFPEGLRSRSSGQVRLTGRERRYRIDGDVTVHRALFDRETDFASQSMDSLGAELRALEERGSLLERVQLDVRVRLAEGLRVQNRKVEVVADGAVTLGGDLLNPQVQGSVSLRDGGTVKLSRATVRLVDGRIDLAGFPSNPPEIDVSGRTQVTGIQVNIDLAGPLDDLRTSLSSPNRSDLTQADLATLLLTGRTAQAAASESGAIVAEEVAAALGSALDERLGGAVLIDVSRDESLIVQDTDPTQRFNIGIPLGEHFYVIYSQALDRSGVRWILDFRPHGQFRVRLISDEVDNGAIEVSHGFEFDLWSRGRTSRTRPPEQPRLREIRLEGVIGADAAELQRRSKLKPGDRYDFFRGDKSARRMQEWLVDQGHRAALVEAVEEPADEGRVDVVFRVEAGRRIEVEWTGDDPGRKLRKRFGETWDAFLTLGETAERRAGSLRHELRAQRYYDATVEVQVVVSDEEARITFDVTRGSRGGGVDVDFEGNDSLSVESLVAALPPRNQADFFALIEPRGRTRLETALRTAGARQGLLSLKVGSPREVFDAESGRLRVTIPIEEGEPSAVVRLDLPEDVLTLPGASPPELRLEVDQPFGIDAYVEDRSTLLSWFRAQGFPEARLAGILDPVPGGLAVRFEADTGPRPRVGAVRPTQGGRTRPSVVDEAVTLDRGDLIRPEDLALSRDHLSETRVFRSVDIRSETTDDAEVRDVVVDLAERPDLNVEYKVRYETGSSRENPQESPQMEESRGFQFGAGIEAANPFGWAHRYSLYGLVGKRRQLLGATFEAQTFFGRRWQTRVFLFDDDERDFETTGLTRRIRTVAFQQTKRWRSGLTGRRWHDRLRMRWGYAYRRINYTDPQTVEELAGNRAAVGSTLIGDTRDSITDPHRGLFWTATAEPNLKVLGSDKDFVRLYGQVFAYVPVGEKVVWAQALRIGVVPGDDPLLLLDRRFKAGGATTVRGFAENGLGPQFRGVSSGGQALFVFNQELRFPLPLWDRLSGGVFFDTGNVWAVSSDFSLGDLRSNVGAGVRVMFPFGPIRLDWAWVLDPQDGEQRSRWQFALGHAF